MLLQKNIKQKNATWSLRTYVPAVFAVIGTALLVSACSEVGDKGLSSGQSNQISAGQVQSGNYVTTNTGSYAAAPAQPTLSNNARLISALLADAGFMGSVKGADRYSVASFYRLRNYEPAWLDQGSWNIDGVHAHQKLAAAAGEGLNPSSYLHPLVRTQLANFTDPNTMLQQDIHMTSGLLSFAKDVKYGRFSKTGGSYPVDSMAAMLNRGYLKGYITNLGPDTPTYQGLRNALITKGDSLSASQRQKIALNMERARWLKDSISTSHHLVVNVPGAELVAYKNGQRDFTMPVVVGRSTRQTPIMKDRIVNLKYSPDWGVPKTVIEKDYLPKLQKDRNYLKNRGFQAFRGREEVDFASIDFKKPNEYKRYSFRKPPGGENPLGGVRFSLTNSQSIFLHDAPGSSQFKASNRAKSSGCVRVGDASKLAQWIHAAQGESLTIAQIKSRMRLEKPKVVPLGNSIGVNLSYNTAWVDESGEVKFAPDIYGLDKALAARMASTI